MRTDYVIAGVVGVVVLIIIAVIYWVFFPG
jgi:hypothetical protein